MRRQGITERNWRRSLKEAGILRVRKEATKNYYYFDPDMKGFDRLIYVLQRAKELTAELPDRSGRCSD